MELQNIFTFLFIAKLLAANYTFDEKCSIEVYLMQANE